MPTALDTSVYVHFPWCARKCPYCDFATRRIEPGELPHAAYADALLRELALRAPGLEGRSLASVFFGGGTPSLWSPRELGRVLAAILDAFASRAEDLEITAECNPSSLTAEGALALREVGVNRLSLGVQSTDDGRLGFLGRLHDSAGAFRALEAATSAHDRVSADLMFGMPGQTPEELEGEIRRVLATGVSHVSAYALTIEPGTRFGELHRIGKLSVAPEDTYAEMFARAEGVFAEAGLAHYEVSNYARPGREARHNLHYWRGGDYVGLGAAAVGCLARAPGVARRWRNESDPARYLARAGEAEAPGGVEEWEEALDGQDLIRESLMLGLRTAEGVDLRRLTGRAGADPLGGREGPMARRLERGDVTLEGDTLRVPRERWLALDSIVADLF